MSRATATFRCLVVWIGYDVNTFNCPELKFASALLIPHNKNRGDKKVLTIVFNWDIGCKVKSSPGLGVSYHILTRSILYKKNYSYSINYNECWSGIWVPNTENVFFSFYNSHLLKDLSFCVSSWCFASLDNQNKYIVQCSCLDLKAFFIVQVKNSWLLTILSFMALVFFLQASSNEKQLKRFVINNNGFGTYSFEWVIIVNVIF